MSGSGGFQRFVAIGLTWAAVFWTTALLFVALAPAHRISPTFGMAVHAAGSLVCHQRAERSFHTHGRRFPVCARCTGLYVSGAIGALVGWAGRARHPRPARWLLIGAAIPTAASVILEVAGVVDVSNMARAFAGVPLGAVASWLFVRMLRAESQPSTCAMIA